MTVHFVKDWETLSLDPRAHLLSVGVVALDNSGNIVSEFYQVIDQTQAQGRHISQDTVAWWATKPDQAARDAIWKEAAPKPAIGAVLALADWVEHIAAGDEIAMWGNGPEADCVWTETFARDNGLEMPWEFWQQQSIRTLKLLHPDCADIGPFQGIKHHALDDARHQAKMLQKFLREREGLIDATCLTSSAPEFVAPYLETTCARCNGTGEPQKYDATCCSECGGKGVLVSPRPTSISDCNHCFGNGCVHCDGLGTK